MQTYNWVMRSIFTSRAAVKGQIPVVKRFFHSLFTIEAIAIQSN